MEVVAAAAAWAVSSACRSVPLDSATWLGSLCQYSHGASNDVSDLVKRLSPQAEIYLPGSDGFAKEILRWSSHNTPEPGVVVVPGVEDDVAETVRYANEKNVPFLAISTGHGNIRNKDAFRGGVQISLHGLNSVSIAEDGATATIGGGISVKRLADALWEVDKQTVTGVCECVSVIGVGLGGGHGILQGRHGLIADQFVSLQVVLADGSPVTVSETSHPDLWWAMRGAGHNFGIVTSATVKVYDVEHRDWAYASFLYSGASVEALYETINNVFQANGPQPAEVAQFSSLFWNSDLDPTQPLILLFIFQEGAASVDVDYVSAFQALNPIVATTGTTPYVGMPGVIHMDVDSWHCAKSGAVGKRFPIDMATFDIPAQRRVYDLFASAVVETPALNESMVLFEGYPLQGMRAVPRESTAYAFRQDDDVQALPFVMYEPAGEALANKATELGEGIRRALHEGTGRGDEMHAYVNYAGVSESPQNCYGYEPWRRERLREAKDKYDPHRRFGFYMPVV